MLAEDNDSLYDPYSDNGPLMRDRDHPGGFSFLRASDSAFWNTWLPFTSKEIEALRFLKWRYDQDQLGEFNGEVPADAP